MQEESITVAAADYLLTVAPTLPMRCTDYGRVWLQNTPEVRQALARALETARARSVRSSLRACLRRLDPEAVPAPAKPTSKVMIMIKRKGTRTWKMEGTATAEGSLPNLATLISWAQQGRGRVRVINAANAAEARTILAAFEAGEWRPAMTAGTGADSDPKQAAVLGLGAEGALAVWAALSPASRGAWTGTGAAIEPETLAALRGQGGAL